MKYLVALAFLFSTSVFASQLQDQFPSHPDVKLTPGQLCGKADTYRYPEHIPYCARKVDGQTKKDRFKEYDSKLGYQTQRMNRMDFKIDHYIPLCMGGSNGPENLWPQHKTIYEITDPMEPLACQRMAEGRLKQAKAIELIKQGKNHLDQVPQVMSYLQSL